MSLGINGWRTPDRASRWPIKLRPRGILASWLCGFRNYVALPHFFARVGIDSHQRPAKSATGVVQIDGKGFFAAGNRDIESPGIQGWRGWDVRRRLIVRLHFPGEIARLGVH